MSLKTWSMTWRGAIRMMGACGFALAACTVRGQDLPVPAGTENPWEIAAAWKVSTPTRERICLNGLWRFLPNLAEAPLPPQEGGGWGWRKVPGVWPGATSWNIGEPAQKTWLSPALAAQGAGDWKKWNAAWYRRDIAIPASWQGRKVQVEFDMVETQAQVFVDGREAGRVVFPGGMADITPFATPGKAQRLDILLTAAPLDAENQVLMGTDKIFKEKAAVTIRGIPGNVYLDGAPPQNAISDVRVECSTRKKSISFDVGLDAPVLPDGFTLDAVVSEAGKPVRAFSSGRMAPGAVKEGRVTFSGSWPDPRLWDTDTPQNVYEVTVSLHDAQGRALDQYLPVRFGFREFWAEGRDLFLNGKKIHLRAMVSDNQRNYEDKSSLEGARETCRRMQEYGCNFFIDGDYSRAPGEVGYLDGIYEAADETGVLASFTMPHGKNFKWRLDVPAVAQAYRREADWLLRQVQNHPSIVMFAVNHNADAYSQGTEPFLMDGTHGAPGGSEEFRKMWAQSGIVESILKGLDPTRLVYHHAGGNLGEVYTLNTYLNWTPRQERSDWLEHWSQAGVKPMFFVEWGMPHIASWSSYRGPDFIWRSRAFQSVWDSEFAAASQGQVAYEMTPPKQALLDGEERCWAGGTPFWFPASSLAGIEPTYLAVQSWFMQDNLRALRAWGISGFLPWDYAGFWTRMKKTEPRPVPDSLRDIQRPGVFPDVVRSGDPGGYLYDREASAFAPTSLGKTMLRWNQPLLAYIGGRAGTFTEKGHDFRPGEKISKSLVLINDTRQERTCEYRAGPDGGDAGLSGKAVLAPGEIKFIPVEFPAPQQGAGSLSAIFDFGGGQVQRDVFSFQVVGGEHPKIASKVWLLDPKGLTGALLSRLGIAFEPLRPESAVDPRDMVVIGREALSDPRCVVDAGKVRNGLRILVFEQDEKVLADRLGFRVNVMGMREAYARSPGHPVMDGIADDLLHDWRGDSTLVPSYVASAGLKTGIPLFSWCGFQNTRIWRYGNRGDVASVLIEKPSRGDWLPLVDCGFDLQYTPLLEYREGKGAVVFCQMDVTGRTEEDPTVEKVVGRLFAYLDAYQAPSRRATFYKGGLEGEALLRDLGVRFQPYLGQPLDSGSLLVLGSGAGAAGLHLVPSGANVLGLGLGSADLAGLALENLRFEDKSLHSETVSDLGNPAFEGISNADLHWRTKLAFTALDGASAASSSALRAVSWGAGTFVLSQAAPWNFDYAAKPYLRTTYRRNLFLTARLLANLGASFDSPLLQKLGAAPAPATVPLQDGWLERPDPDGLGESQSWWKPDMDEKAWRPTAVPGSYDYLGSCWYRLRFRMGVGGVPPTPKLCLGAIDDESWVWLNGQLLGKVTQETNPKDYWIFPREYDLPAGLLRADGENTLVVRVNNLRESGGIFGRPYLRLRKEAWLESYYLQKPEAADDPYRYYGW